MKRKPLIPKDVDPIELADEMKLSVFDEVLKRLRKLGKTKSQ